jgi:hypothetical protein
MASIDRTAYPRFKRNISVRELREAYTPSLEEMDWARRLTGTAEALLSVVLWLKCCQRLGYFPKLDQIPVTVIEHVRQELGLHEATAVACVPERTTRNHKSLVRHQLGLSADQGAARKFACEAIRAASQTKDNPADLINIALEELVKTSCELPAFSTLDRLAGEIRAHVNQDFQHAAHGLMTAEEQGRLLGLLRVDPLTRRSGHDQLKQIAPRATVSRLRRHLDHLAWLDGIGGGTGTWLKDSPASKIEHFAGEAAALDAAEMADTGPVKRVVLEACLLHRARVRARDDLVTMLCKRSSRRALTAGCWTRWRW